MSQKSKKFHHRWPVCPSTNLQRLGERKDVKLALRAAARSRTQADITGGECTWAVVTAFQCSACNGWHLSRGAGRQLEAVAS